MKTMQLEAMGLQELSLCEKKDIAGGWLLAGACVALAIIYLGAQCLSLYTGGNYRMGK